MLLHFQIQQQNPAQANNHDHGANSKRVRLAGPSGHQQPNQQQEFHHQQSQQQMMFNNSQQQHQRF